MKMYAVQARVVSNDGRTRSLPTFYLHPNVQGIVSETHAETVALMTIDPFGQFAETYVSIAEVDL